MGRCEIDALIRLAKHRNIEVNEITINADAHDALVDELKPMMRHDVNPVRGPCWKLEYNGVVIHRRKCTGCCIHV